MSSNLLPYKFKSKQWHKAEGINESDVAVIVDPNRDLIWYFEGNNSSARKRNKARNSLGELKDQHATYKFKKVNRSTPRDIIREFAILKEDFYINAVKNLNINVSAISKSNFYLNCLGGLLNIISFVFSLLFLIGSNTGILDNSNHYILNAVNFQSYLLLQFTTSLISFIFYALSAVISSLFKQRTPAIFNILGSILSFMAFFMIIVSDSLIYSDIMNQQVFIRADVFILFNIHIGTLYLISLVIAFIMGTIGFKRIDQIIKDKEEF
ncbi:MAG: hypothetical protein EU532_14490 [Promethearchaeota archaeon]|nr:MAG: hypothetical protein EU532_14490 [Candidatus Lokiarchaeota archaeon]